MTPDEPLTDEALRARTERLLRSAEMVSLRLKEQTEQLAAAITLFEREAKVRYEGPQQT